MARFKNIKIDFTGTSYTPSSTFTLQADGGDYVDAPVTYNQLTHTGPGYDMEVGPTSTTITITSTGLGQSCFRFSVTSSFNPWPSPLTSPIMFPSTDANMRSIGRTYGLTQDTGDTCNDIYLFGGDKNEVKRLHNITAEEYTNKGPFTNLSSSEAPYISDAVYIPEYDAIAFGAEATENYGGSGTVYPNPDYPSISIISMSGDFLFKSDPNSTRAVVNTEGNNLQVVGDYLYGLGQVFKPNCTNVPPLPFCIKAGCWRIHLPTMTMDYDWIDNVASNFGEPLRYLLVGSGSNTFYTVRSNAIRRYDVSGSLTYSLVTNNSIGSNQPIAFDSSGSIIAGGYFSSMIYYSGSTSVPVTPSYTQYGIVQLDEYLDFRPYSSSFSRYTINPFNSALGISRYGPYCIALDSNDNIIVGFQGADPINSNISGSYVNVSGSLAVLDPTGSMLSGWNYPQNVDISSNEVKYTEISRLSIQQDDSIIAILDKYTPSTPNLDLTQYDNKVVGTQMIVSQSGVVTDY